ncbi:MAG TPA: efflux RND transporter periplasmic adaptor subunit [Metalysinibacillus jejuensis]|uniref:Efflux RND transporter periplasmic adaptor subunit n=1 Tax=Metalysinibacillus jejuensis TaxID=914327 RepID=A0A921T4E4_9BACL|nr:efflux RND transporter periplasmic adaptor subunit [Metalysinibacillus jejuensis]HJH10457.1 efflux RND transporter periplasmic adaptor subunit [Metalysinibacillus jejuensis]
MNKKKKIVVISVISIALVVAVVFAIMKFTATEGDMEAFDEPLMTEPVAMQELGETILVTGKIIPTDEQKVFAEGESGEIKEFFVKENQQIKAGAPLFAYDTTKVSNEYSKAVRARDLTNNRLNITINELAAARKQLTDMKKNPELSKEELNAAAKDIVSLEMDIENIKGEVSSLQETINDLAATKEKMVVKSKIDGIIVKINKNVEPSENGSSEPIVHIISSGPFKVIGSMSEFDTVKIKKDQPVIIRPKVFKDRTWNGVIESVSHFPGGEGGDEMGGGNVTMYPFKVAITDDTSELRQGFHVSLEINVSDLAQSKQLAIPHLAIDIDETGEEFVYVLTSDNILEKRAIVLGDSSDEFAGILEGLEEGERVVVNPYIVAQKGLEVGKEVKEKDLMPADDMMDDEMLEEDMTEPTEEMEPQEVPTEEATKDEAN